MGDNTQFIYPLSTMQRSHIVARVTHMEAFYASTGSSHWLDMFSSPLPALKQLVIRGVGLQFIIGAEPYRTISHNDNFLSSISTLKTLAIWSVSLTWPIFTPPSSLRYFELDYRRFSPPTWPNPGPDLEPGSTIPSLLDLRNILVRLPLLETLCLSGIFEHPSPYTSAPPGAIVLPVLHTLSLSGSCTMNSLISSLITPVLRNLHIATNAWLSITHFVMLANYTGICTHPAGAIATISAGLNGNDADTDFRLNVRPRVMGEAPCISLQCIGAESSWEYMADFNGTDCISELVINDCPLNLWTLRPTDSRTWEFIGRYVIKNVERLWIEGGTRWARAVVGALSTSPTVWPKLRSIDFDVSLATDREEKATVGICLTDMMMSGRRIEVTLQGRCFSSTLIEALITDIPPAKGSPYLSWLEYVLD